MAGLVRGRSVDVAAAQLVATEAGLLVGAPAPADLPATPLDMATRFHILGARDEETLALLSRALTPSARAASG
jgi:hypothetical protein